MDRPIYVGDVERLERQAETSGKIEDAAFVHGINFYNQRPFWYWIFMGLTAAFDVLFCFRNLETFPAPSYSSEYFEIAG